MNTSTAIAAPSPFSRPIHNPDDSTPASLAGTFRPMLENKHAGKEKGSWLPDFNASSFFSYYPLLRLGGYMAEVGFSSMASNAAKKLEGAANAGAPAIESRTLKENLKDFNNIPHEDLKKYLTRGEAGLFFGLASAFGYGDYKRLKDDCTLAVAAERGQDASKVGVEDIKRSNNPIVSSAVDRFKWQQVMRHGAALGFIRGIPTGVVTNGLLITAERTIFYRPIAFDILKKAVNDVQLNNLGVEAKSELVDDLVRTAQAARMDHRRGRIPKEQIDGLRPVLNRIAQDIIDKRFGLVGALYIMGGGVLVPESPEISAQNYEHVRNVGVSGIAEEGRWIRERSGTAPGKTWESQLRATREHGYVAESATEESLLKGRDDLHARGPIAAGAAERSRRGSETRGGTGMVF